MNNNFTRQVGKKASGLIGATITPSTVSTTELAKASPNYDLSNRGNRVRIGETIPVVYGRHIVYPDFAAEPYLDTGGGFTWRNHVMVIGHGEFDIESLRVGNTTFASYGADLTYEIVQPGGEVTLFPPSLTTSLGTDTPGFTTRLEKNSLTYNGPYPVSPPGTVATQITVTIGYPTGLYAYAYTAQGYYPATAINDVELRLIDDVGEPLGTWFVAATDSNVNTGIITAFVRTLVISPTPGRYEIRVRNRVYTSGIQGPPDWTVPQYKELGRPRFDGWSVEIDTVREFGNLTVLAVRMKSTVIDEAKAKKINCTVLRKIRTWREIGDAGTPSGFSAPIGTSSPVWALMDLLTNTTYGGRVAISRLDLPTFEALANELIVRGDEFNGIFDKKLTLWEAAKLICQVARCTPILRRGIITIVRDKLQTNPVIMLTPRNIVSGSFAISYDMPQEDDNDGIKVEYLSASTWLSSETAVTPTGGVATNPRTIKLFGVTGAAQARREALYLARQTYRRTTISLQTELEGQILTFGDLVAVAHDMPSWGVSGDVVRVDPSGDIVLSDPSILDEPGTLYASFRTSTGAMAGPFEVDAGETRDSIALIGSWLVTFNGDNVTFTRGGDTVNIYTGYDYERTQFMAGVGNSFYKLCIVKAIKTNGNITDLTLISEDSRVHED